MNRYLEAAREIAREAGALLLDASRRPRKIEYKGGVDIVTSTDRASEALIVERLAERFPRHSVIAEEGGGREESSEFVWYVDPLDGTTNFAHGYPFFAVSMALVREGRIQVGVVHDPMRDETFSAVLGEGAWLSQKQMQVSATEHLRESLLSSGFPVRKRHKSYNTAYFHTFTNRSHGVRRDGSAALDLCYVGCGRFDGFWEFNLKEWDVAAGILIVREAGGLVTDLHSVPYRLGGSSIVATNKRIHAEVCRLFSEVDARAAAPLA